MLAEKLGMPVSLLLDNISSEEMTEWVAYFKIKNEHEKAAIEEAKNTPKPPPIISQSMCPAPEAKQPI